MGRKAEGGYYSVIPSPILFHKDIPGNAKLLYAVLTNLCDSEGYCWASNEYLAALFEISERTVSRWISQLEKLGFIRLEMVSNAKGSERRIYAGLFVVSRGGVDKNVYTGVDKNGEGGIDKNVHTPKGNILNINNQTVNIPPIAPQGGGRRALSAREVSAKSGPSRIGSQNGSLASGNSIPGTKTNRALSGRGTSSSPATSSSTGWAVRSSGLKLRRPGVTASGSPTPPPGSTTPGGRTRTTCRPLLNPTAAGRMTRRSSDGRKS